MSSFRPFAGVRASIREAVTGKPQTSDDNAAHAEEADSDEENEEQDKKDKEAAQKSEKTTLRVLRDARKKFIARGIVGSIEICTTWGMISNSISAEVSEEDIAGGSKDEGDEETSSALSTDTSAAVASASAQQEGGADKAAEEDEQQMSYTERLAIGGMNRILKMLEWRSSTYENVSYNESLSLSRSVTFAPPLPVTVFSLSVTFEATVTSLLASRKKRQLEAEEKKKMKKAAAV